MSNRLNQEREQKLTPSRMETAKSELNGLGLNIVEETADRIKFMFRGSIVTYYPYSGWATGKTIKDGRGLQNLLKQL